EAAWSESERHCHRVPDHRHRGEVLDRRRWSTRRPGIQRRHGERGAVRGAGPGARRSRALRLCGEAGGEMAIRMKLTGTRNAPLRVRAAGSALLVYPKGGEDSRPVEFMARRAIEPGQTVIGLEVDPDDPPEVFEGILDELASCPGTLRLVPVRSGAASTLNLGAW